MCSSDGLWLQHFDRITLCAIPIIRNGTYNTTMRQLCMVMPPSLMAVYTPAERLGRCGRASITKCSIFASTPLALSYTVPY